ncbi:MAG: exodeoxyribonuclease VII small subunit [Dermabacter sp.]|nr:exodeoxyribonuclease VII small subunit [Dermabacter sp.]
MASKKTTTADATPALPADIQALGYEAARDELFEIVRALESGSGSLEESIALWERGELLSTRCQQWLDGARERLDAAINRHKNADAEPETDD